MIYSNPRAAGPVYAVPTITKRPSSFPVAPYPKALRATQRPQRAAILTRRYETTWLTQDGMVETATRIAPALPQFEEAFSAIARGTLIETTQGFCAVEDLEPGMTVLTAEGRTETITWIGSMTLFPPNTIPGIEASKLTRITAEAFGPGRPMPDLMLGQQARVLLKGGRCRSTGHDAAYAMAAKMIDGESIVEVTPVAPVTMFHVVLARHGSLRCAGIEVEAYHPGKHYAERFDPQLAALFLAMFPHMKSITEFGTMAHPRLSAEETEDLIAA